MLSGGTLFEELGLLVFITSMLYFRKQLMIHNVNELVSVLENIRDNKFNKPIFLHCII